MFLKKIVFEHWTSWGYIVVLRNFTRNLRMFLDISKLCKENRKNGSGKTVLKMRSQTLGNQAVLVHEISFKERCKKVRTNKS